MASVQLRWLILRMVSYLRFGFTSLVRHPELRGSKRGHFQRGFFMEFRELIHFANRTEGKQRSTHMHAMEVVRL